MQHDYSNSASRDIGIRDETKIIVFAISQQQKNAKRKFFSGFSRKSKKSIFLRNYFGRNSTWKLALNRHKKE